MSRGEIVQHGVFRRPTRALGSAERSVGEQAYVVVDAVLGDAARDVVVAPGIDLDLNGRDLDDAPRLFDLSDSDVAEADVLDESVALQRGERTHARRQRCARVDCVKLIEGDSLCSQRPHTRLARGAEM